MSEQGLSVKEFQKKTLALLAERWEIPYSEAAEKVREWVSRNPNPNDPPVREFRTKHVATRKDAMLHRAMLRKTGQYTKEGDWLDGVAPKSGKTVEIKKQGGGSKMVKISFKEPEEDDVPDWVKR